MVECKRPFGLAIFIWPVVGFLACGWMKTATLSIWTSKSARQAFSINTMASCCCDWRPIGTCVPSGLIWRKSVRNSAADLDQFIRSQFRGQPVSIVAHSMGGLVARSLFGTNNGIRGRRVGLPR